MGEPLRILMAGHSCSPMRGSEPGGVWNWAAHVAERHRVWLICHPQYREEYEQLPAQSVPRNLEIHWTSLPRALDPLNPARSDEWLRLHYLLWLRVALRTARALHRVHRFDLVHHVGLGSVSAPSPFWRLGIPVIWGPIGGGQTAPAQFRDYFGAAWRAEWMRNVRVRALPYSPVLRRTLAHCDLVLTANNDTRRLVERAGARNVHDMVDSGTPDFWFAPKPVVREAKRETVLVWWGRLEAHKALGLGLEAFAQTERKELRLWVAGDGPMRKEWEELTHRLQLAERVRFLGRVSREVLRDLAFSADAFLFTSLRESFGSVVLEAMGTGLPVITLAHQGVGAFMSDDAGLKAPVSSPSATKASLAGAMDCFAALGQPARQRMGEAAWLQAREQRWSDRAAKAGLWYDELAGSAPGVGGKAPMGRVKHESRT